MPNLNLDSAKTAVLSVDIQNSTATPADFFESV